MDVFARAGFMVLSAVDFHGSLHVGVGYGRYGYRMITGLLNNAGWHVNDKLVDARQA